MALRPPRQRRRRANPFGQSLPDEAVGLFAGFLLASTGARLLALAAGLEQWTTSWRVLNALTVWMVWPLDRIGFAQEPQLIGFLRPLDIVVGVIVIVGALFLLATRTYDRRA